jgi:large subunit ribosomal protein L9
MATKLLLIQDVEDLGRSGDVVSVKPGYARNYLLPLKMAYIADKRTLRIQERLKQERSVRAAEDRKQAETLASQLVDVTLTAIVKVDPEGHMYGSVSAYDVAKLLAEQAKIEVEKRSVNLKHAIKELGIYKVPLRLKEGVESIVVVKVQTEDGSIEPPSVKASASSEELTVESQGVREEEPPRRRRS